MFHPVEGHTDPEENRSIAEIFHDFRTRCGWVFNVMPRPPLPREIPVPIEKETGWAPGPVWIGAENLAPTGSIPGPSSP